MRIAAVGDLHVGPDSRGRIAAGFADLREHADLILLAGDLTQHGDPDEARVLAEELADLSVPAFAVLGNHDYHRGQEDVIRRELEAVGIRVLECEAASLEVGATRVGIAGAKGFGGGFAGACCSEFGEPEMKAFVRTTKQIAERLEHLLQALDADVRIALTHYAPIDGTLMGERLEIFPFLGSYLLGEAIDRGGCRLALHGHAHRGRERGVTPGGVPVRNVARPVIQHAYRVYSIDGHEHEVPVRSAERPVVASA
jgi:Icc-related predicted phosphoesterase